MKRQPAVTAPHPTVADLAETLRHILRVTIRPHVSLLPTLPKKNCHSSQLVNVEWDGERGCVKRLGNKCMITQDECHADVLCGYYVSGLPRPRPACPLEKCATVHAGLPSLQLQWMGNDIGYHP